MALQQIKFAPGIDKQDTSVGAVGRCGGGYIY